MIVFDTLSFLEHYALCFKGINHVIAVMDRSLPYTQDEGSYSCPECKDVRYVIDRALSSDQGFSEPKTEEKNIMEIVLEGQEAVVVNGSVFRLTLGRFLLYNSTYNVKRGLSYALPEYFKAVRFFF